MTITSKGEYSDYRITRSKLHGSVRVSGAKNSVLRLMAASLLTAETVEIGNYPATLLDAQVHLGMLQALGKECFVSGNQLIVHESTPISSQLVWPGRSIRNTLLILGALVARTGSGSVPSPGGCPLGERKYDLHEMVLRSMGAEVWEADGCLYAHASGRLRGAEIYLPIRSTGATENAILCGTLAEGVTRIWNPHVRPEILDLIAFLNSLGAKISVYGQEHIAIEGVECLTGGRHDTIADNMEALTWFVAAVMTGGEIEIENFPFDDLEVPLIHLRESGARFYRSQERIIVRGGRCYPIEISTGPYPSINSDMQPLFALFGACARGESRITDLRFPGRYGYAEELAKMGVDSKVDGMMLRLFGGSPMRGATVRALDLRAGIALTLAGLVADGETVLTDAWQVERGYDSFVDKLRMLGGNIESDCS